MTNSASYAVTVGTQPSGLTCSVVNGTDTVTSANVTNVAVSCAQPWAGTKLLGVAGAATEGKSVATDASGYIYGGGLDGNTPTGTLDFILTKYNSSGVKQ